MFMRQEILENFFQATLLTGTFNFSEHHNSAKTEDKLKEKRKI